LASGETAAENTLRSWLHRKSGWRQAPSEVDNGIGYGREHAAKPLEHKLQNHPEDISQLYYRKPITMPDTIRDILLAFVRVHILHHAVSERIYGSGMAEELARHGYKLSPGTLYPLLHRLEEEGLLVSESEVVKGKVRRYYTATASGKRALKAVQPRLAELLSEALPEKPTHATRHPK